MIGQTISHYKIVEKLGEGGMGVVYKAQDLKLDRFVALKFLPPHLSGSDQEKARFMQEAKSASALNHPNVCTIYGVEEHEGQQYIEMELVDGATLRKTINPDESAQTSLLSIKQVIDYGIQIGEALQDAHSKGIIHRDVKAENIMVNAKHQIKVMDFGLAKLKGSLKLTRTSSTVGTLAYMAPEQIQGKEADHRSDIFSYGVVLYEMLTGRTPFRGDHEAAVMYSIVNEEPDTADKYRRDTPGEFLHILRKALEKDPEDRYQSVAEMVVDLRRLKKESTRVDRTQQFVPLDRPVVPQSPEQPRPKSGRHIPVNKYSIGAGIGLLLIAGFFLLRNQLTFFSSPASDKKFIAVLPFENLGSAEQDYFVDGMTDEVTSRLSGVSGLGVIARSSAMQYKKTTKTFKQVGNELNVDYILQGTVRWETTGGETHVRVNPSLIKVSDGTQAWSGSMESVLSSAFKLQADIASRVASALDVALLKSEKQTLETSLTNNAEAYDYYLRAIEYSTRSVAKSDFEIAEELLNRAITADPSFAAAYARLSFVQSNMYWFFYDRSESRVEKSRKAAEKSVALSPQLSESHEAMGWYFYHAKLDYPRSLEEFALALKYGPSNSNVHYGIAAVKRRQGDMRGAAESFRKTIAGNPRGADLIRQLGETLTLSREYEDADRSYSKALELSPDITAIYWEKAKNALLWKGDIDRARHILEDARRFGKDEGADQLLIYMTYYIEMLAENYPAAESALQHRTSEEDDFSQFQFFPTSLLRARIELQRGNQVVAKKYFESARVFLEQKLQATPNDERLYSSIGLAFAGLGRKEEAVRAAKRAVELLPIEKEAWRGSFRLYDLARVYEMTGDQEQAINTLERLLSIPSEVSGTLLKIDPAWNSLHGNSRFQKLIAEHNT